MYVFKYEETHKAMVSVEESSVARKRVWTYERSPRASRDATLLLEKIVPLVIRALRGSPNVRL